MSLFLLLCILTDKSLYAKKYIAFSLKNAEKTIANCNNTKEKFPEIFRLYGINNIKAAIYDKKNKDIIIIGSIEHNSTSYFSLDDLVIILRSIFIYGKGPYVALNPEKAKNRLNVYFESGIKNTHIGNELLDIALNIQKMAKDILHSKTSKNLVLISFIPDVRIRDNVLIINGFKQYLITDADKERNMLQKNIAQYIFPRLKVITQLVALVQAIEQMHINKADLWFWLKNYKIDPVNTPKDIKAENKIFCAVKIFGMAFHSRKIDIKKLKKWALKMRPEKEKIVWNFEIKDEEGSKKNNTLAKEKEKKMSLFSEGWFLYRIKKSFYKAIDTYSRLIEMEPDWEIPYYFRAAVYNELGQYKKAIDDYEQAIKINPAYTLAYISKGYSYNYMSMYKKAIKSLNKALKISPYHIDAYNNRGIAYCGIGDYKKGIIDFDNVINLAPDFGIAYINKGKANFCLGEYKKAIKVLNKAIELLPDFAEAYCNRGIAFRYLGQYQKALKNFNKAIQIDQYYAYAYIQRGLTYEDMCRWKEADKDIKKAVQLDPNIFSIYIFGVIKLRPRTSVEYHERGHAYFCIGEWKKAIADFDNAIRLKPDFASAYFYRGLSYDNLKDYKKAISDYTRAISLVSNNAVMYNNRGTAYYKCKKYKKALEDFNKAIELEPDNPVFYENRLRIYLRIGKNNQVCEDALHACKLGKCKFYYTLRKRGVCK